MVLDKWTTGDLVDADSANKRGIRRGTTTDRDGIGATGLDPGDHFFNETLEHGQLLLQEGPNKWGNYGIHPLDADSIEVTVTGNTPTQVKDLDFAVNPDTFVGFLVLIIAEIKTSNAGTTASFRVRKDGGGTDDLVLTTVSTTYEIKKGSFSPAFTDGRHTLEFFMDDGIGDTISNRLLEIWGV